MICLLASFFLPFLFPIIPAPVPSITFSLILSFSSFLSLLPSFFLLLIHNFLDSICPTFLS